jgi:hypothetical protein
MEASEQPERSAILAPNSVAITLALQNCFRHRNGTRSIAISFAGIHFFEPPEELVRAMG